jgi:exocyst complex component 7
MTWLEDEFHHVLSARALDLEALSSLSSLSMASDRSNSDAIEALCRPSSAGATATAPCRASSRLISSPRMQSPTSIQKYCLLVHITHRR